jgi:oxygen-independent coproporphyrinogen-3 oxidase
MKKRREMVFSQRNCRKSESDGENVDLFWGGTPSVLTSVEIDFLIAEVYENYSVVENPEITLEANPDDLSSERILNFRK